MSVRMIVELSEGNKVLFGGQFSEIGLSEVGLGDDISRVSREKFKAALGSLVDLVNTLEDSIGRMAQRPHQVEMEFGASLSGDCTLWVVSGEGKAEFKVKLKWGNRDK